MIEDLFTELPVPLLSTAALLRHHHTRYQPYQRLHQPQHFHHTALHDLHTLQQRTGYGEEQVNELTWARRIFLVSIRKYWPSSSAIWMSGTKAEWPKCVPHGGTRLTERVCGAVWRLSCTCVGPIRPCSHPWWNGGSRGFRSCRWGGRFVTSYKVRNQHFSKLVQILFEPITTIYNIPSHHLPLTSVIIIDLWILQTGLKFTNMKYW